MAKCADEVDFNHDDDDDVRTSTMGVTKQEQRSGGSGGGGWVLCANVCKRKILLQSEGSLCCLSAQGRVNGSRRRRAGSLKAATTFCCKQFSEN